MPPYRTALADLMAAVQIETLEELSRRSGLTEWQLRRAEWGLLPKLSLEAAQRLAETLHISLGELSQNLGGVSGQPQSNSEALARECQRLQGELAGQSRRLEEEFRRSALQILEPWLRQWPSAVSAAEVKPDWPARKLVPLARPVFALLEAWGVESLGAVGEIVAYDPQWHEVLEGAEPAPGEPAQIRYSGYRQGESLLFRAKVSRPRP
ncbi:MAG: helix-turn-helix domain-containing protein [Cyanobacteriota bacterium]|nr:helix-turn-helix domain-containing protein [Cyanobacteriota bacterium]